MRRVDQVGRQRGFTLLEVLVALVVLGLLVLGLSHGVRGGLALRQAQVQRVAENADLDSTMRLLRLVFTRMPVVAEAGQATNREPHVALRGEAEQVTFVGNLPTGVGGSRRADMTLQVRDGRLILSWTPARHERAFGPRPPATDTELLQGVRRLDLAYWSPPGTEQPAGWQSRWDQPDLPELIRVRLVFAENDRRRWSDLIAAPRQ